MIEYFFLIGVIIVGVVLYVVQLLLMVQKGIVGIYCKMLFVDLYVFISNLVIGVLFVYIIGFGQVLLIVSVSIEKILCFYIVDELVDGVMEFL